MAENTTTTTDDRQMDEIRASYKKLCAGKSREEIEEIQRQIEEVLAPGTNAGLDEGDERDIPRLRSATEREQFDVAYFDILRARAAQNAPDSGDTEMDDAQLLESDAVHRLIGTPAYCVAALWQKLECLDVYLREVDDSYYDKRTHRLYASVKADLETLGMGPNSCGIELSTGDAS